MDANCQPRAGRHVPASALPLVIALILSVAPGASASIATWSRDDAAHLLRRAGFGGTPQQVDRLHALGRDRAVEYLLAGQLPPDAHPVFESVKLEDFKPGDDPGMNPRAALQKADLTPAEREQLLKARQNAKPGEPPDPSQLDPALRRKLQQVQRSSQVNRRQEIDRLRVWWVDRMLRTDRPLEEKMSLFWHGLFTSGAREVKVALFMANQNALFHRHALGNYRKLTDAVVHDPAMLRYLDNDKNVAGRPNENLARELMELFTMGEGSGYTEKDIAEVARALTGLAPTPAGRALLRPRGHDGGEKTIFGKTGRFGPDDVVGLIFDRPEPSRYLARRLWEFFAYPNPTDEDLRPVAEALKSSGYELKPALRAIFTHPAFYSEQAKFALIKSPVELAVSTMRLLERPAQENDVRAVERRLRAMDQELLQPPSVRGWVGGDNWITAATLYARYNTATAMINGGLRQDMPGGSFKGPAAKGTANAAASAGQAGQAGPDSTAKGKRPGMRPGMRPRDAGGRGAGAPPVEVTKLFPSLPQGASPAQLVDRAVARFLQRPLNAEKRNALLDVMGQDPVTLGRPEDDRRVRQMLALLLSTPEYQVQ